MFDWLDTRMSSGSVISPFRIALILATAVQLGAYAVVVIYSLLVGQVDFAWPLKAAFITGLGFVVYLTWSGVKRAWPIRRVDFDLFAEYLTVFLFDVGGTVVVLYISLPTLLQSFGAESLISVQPDVKFFASAAVAIVVFFLILLAYQAANLKRRQPLPTVPLLPERTLNE